MCKTAVGNSSWNLESMIFITDTVLVTSDLIHVYIVHFKQFFSFLVVAFVS